MKPPADIVVYSPDDQIQLVVEVKSEKGATDIWAAEMRRNLITHAAVPRSKFFLLALPDHFYLRRDSVSTDVVPADYKVWAREALRLYLENMTPKEVSGESFELLVRSWLSDLINSDDQRNVVYPFASKVECLCHGAEHNVKFALVPANSRKRTVKVI